MTYETEIETIYADAEISKIGDDLDLKLREIVRYGTLAPSSHNTQCWRFRTSKTDGDGGGAASIRVLPDFDRRCPVVDPDDHHLYCTLGCAVENISVAARAFGFDADVDSSEPQEGIDITLTPRPNDEVSPMFEAIPRRQCTRTEYDSKPLTDEELEILRLAGTGDGVEMLLFTDGSSRDKILNHVLLANSAQIKNPKFAEELKLWIRFSEEETVTSGDGLNGKQMGSPFVPRFVAEAIFNVMFRPSFENAKIRRQVESSAGFAIFVSEIDDPVHWVEAGRCYERFALQATALGIRNAMLNMPVEEADARPKFADDLGLNAGSRPDLVVRFGRGPEVPRSLRRPVDEVLVN